jgi:hypothetical protein
MARKRMIKPEFFTDRRVCACTPLARLLFQGTWGVADREGRLEYDPFDLKIRLLPADVCNVEELVEELVGQGLVALYQVEGHAYLSICNFLKHQKPHCKEAPSVLPAPPATLEATRSRQELRAAQARARRAKGKAGLATPTPDVEEIQTLQDEGPGFPVQAGVFPGEPGLSAASSPESESESESESKASSLPSAPTLHVVPTPNAEPGEEVEKHVDPDAAPRVFFPDHGQLCDAWDDLRACLERAPDREARSPATAKLFAGDLSKYDCDQWTHIFRDYLLTSALKGLGAAERDHPLSMCTGAVRRGRAPRPRSPGRVCFACQRVGSWSNGPTERAVCGACSQAWWADLVEAFPVPECSREPSPEIVAAEVRLFEITGRAERAREVERDFAERRAEYERERDAKAEAEARRDANRGAHFSAWVKRPPIVLCTECGATANKLDPEGKPACFDCLAIRPFEVRHEVRH